MRRPQPAIRLRLRRIELKPKHVFDQRWSDYAGVRNRPELQDELIAIIRSITRGDGVPEAHYRAGIDQDEDALLAGLGVMHLHLGGNDSDVIVFLIQYADRVVLLETNSHIQFPDTARGQEHCPVPDDIQPARATRHPPPTRGINRYLLTYAVNMTVDW